MKNKVFLCILALIFVVGAVVASKVNKTELISYQIVVDLGYSIVVYIYTDRTVEAYNCPGSFDLMQSIKRDDEKILAIRLHATEYREVERLVEIIKVSSAEDFYVKLMGTGMTEVNIKVGDRIIEIPRSVHFPTRAMGDLMELLTGRFAKAMGR